ncbi:transcription factor 25 [Ananas comosus]|uniref:Transcription factor 25 n=1 Tax=Ananas comosus TaxID=4615 RepID=A0A6P5EWI6_ANACO|nr:transcription factor 25 [Ananas comosus]XP_020088171.1 transcription factor 25 [Ananas comosus]XP_020088172.1 transcription factor 25 [Ananas comosus]
MSARLLRRVLKEQEEKRLGSSEPDPDLAIDADGDEESGSPPASASASMNPFDLLDDDQEDEVEASVGDLPLNVSEHQTKVRNQICVIPPSKRKSKKKKKKNKADSSSKTNLKDEKSLDAILEDLSIGPSPPTHQTSPQSTNVVSAEAQRKTQSLSTSSVLTVDPKFLKAENELRKIFGSKVVNSFENHQSGGSSRQIHGGRRAAHNPRKTLLISPSSHWPRWDWSMSMELLETKDGVNYFRYVHSDSCAHAQEAFEAAKAANDLNAIASILAHYPYHVESLLTFAEVFKYSGEHQSSADAIGKCLFALECAWHPLFSPLQGNSQLKYNHDTNKPFFSALFSHMKNMDRRGCHRSALEVCKFLLSLDSDDPKGALFCIDYFALRSQEYDWLERFAEEYRTDSSLWLYPNFSYSLAIARFYLERDSAQREGAASTEKAASLDLMKQALMLHPLVLKKLVAKAPLKDSTWTQILKNSFFGSAKPGSPSLEHLIDIYVERSYLMWRFPELQNLLKDAALLVIELLKQNSREAQDWSCVRKEAFSSEKNEYSHLMVSEFSDTIPSLPPEELRQIMVGPQVVHEMQGVVREEIHEAAHAPPREVAGRNAAIIFLESLLPWVDYGHDVQQDDHD